MKCLKNQFMRINLNKENCYATGSTILWIQEWVKIFSLRKMIMAFMIRSLMIHLVKVTKLDNVESKQTFDIQLEENGNDAHDEEFNNSTDNELQRSNDSSVSGSSAEIVSQHENFEKMTPSSSGVQLAAVNGDEPFVGQEFESEAAAHAFYSAYGMRLGFITRIHYNTRSKRDGVGCKAMLSVRKVRSGNWVVTKFVKEHTHLLAGGQAQKTVLCNQIAVEDMRIHKLTQELLVEKKRSTSLKRCIDLLFNHIEEHTQGLSKKIQYIVDSVNMIESEGKAQQIA
ncbi:hypothetical protein Patl1_23967 [Pistacia atlantica]|uniref:Uncharacterized protein n=1 Tax=Pistacia atlantica TaxID=434234 RepID=A0ACC0ZY52_9ROSI|nr:hypothetical protein Patl1_23967 [Pistacia atlantica]